MTDDHSRPASDGGFPMIYRPTRRIVATACIHCRLSELTCAANVDLNGARCCERCDHEES